MTEMIRETSPVAACRSCGAGDLVEVLDLGDLPACDYFPEYAGATSESEQDPGWPLALVLCRGCGLAQLSHDSPAPEVPLAVESESIRRHAQQVSATVVRRAGVDAGGTFHEFSSGHGGSWDDALVAAGLVETAGPAMLVVDNHSIIHAEDFDAALGRRVARLSPDGTLAIEFHHALEQVSRGQFDTIRHGHPVYLSLHAWQAACARHGLSITDAWTEPVYGGCLVVLARRGVHSPSSEAVAILDRERDARLSSPEGYADLAAGVTDTRTSVTRFLEEAKAAGRRVAAYGAGSKAVTLVGVCGLDSADLTAVADLSPAKQGRRIPGTGIPIVSPQELIDSRPDDVVVLTWDIATEVAAALRSGGLTARLVTPVPTIRDVP